MSAKRTWWIRYELICFTSQSSLIPNVRDGFCLSFHDFCSHFVKDRTNCWETRHLTESWIPRMHQESPLNCCASPFPLSWQHDANAASTVCWFAPLCWTVGCRMDRYEMDGMWMEGRVNVFASSHFAAGTKATAWSRAKQKAGEWRKF